MADPFAAKLRALGFALPEGVPLPSEELVDEFERRFDLTLPSDFRTFLGRHGGEEGMATCPIIEPTPFGTSTFFSGFYGFEDEGIARTTELIDGAPAIIALGHECLGRMFWLVCAQPDFGHVVICDHYGRSSWSDDDFFKWPDLAAEIHQYLDLRRAGLLPSKPDGFEDIYLVARSFTDFFDSLQPYNEED